jgi:hypothetical protein
VVFFPHHKLSRSAANIWVTISARFYQLIPFVCGVNIHKSISMTQWEAKATKEVCIAYVFSYLFSRVTKTFQIRTAFLQFSKSPTQLRHLSDCWTCFSIPCWQQSSSTCHLSCHKSFDYYYIILYIINSLSCDLWCFFYIFFLNQNLRIGSSGDLKLGVRELFRRVHRVIRVA